MPWRLYPGVSRLADVHRGDIHAHLGCLQTAEGNINHTHGLLLPAHYRNHRRFKFFRLLF
ncbi:Uncharacterised protein [Citrobacter koseri]|uniref:Uncharacterized protein n=1 Tax=Citrobacter koseri TaxID=545 RepID=A0A3S4JTT0_CITKO|nr:Uncharacterised protein [Citrobacter koseri]